MSSTRASGSAASTARTWRSIASCLESRPRTLPRRARASDRAARRVLFQTRGLQGNPPIDDRRFGEQKPVARVARVNLRGRGRRAADEPDRLLHGQQAVERDRLLRVRQSGIRLQPARSARSLAASSSEGGR